LISESDLLLSDAEISRLMESIEQARNRDGGEGE